MNGREESAALLAQIQPSVVPSGLSELCLIGMAVKRHLDAIDEDLQELRAELQDRNGGENDH